MKIQDVINKLEGLKREYHDNLDVQCADNDGCDSVLLIYDLNDMYYTTKLAKRVGLQSPRLIAAIELGDVPIKRDEDT